MSKNRNGIIVASGGMLFLILYSTFEVYIESGLIKLLLVLAACVILAVTKLEYVGL
jgi:hypothetical protein